tara:strand:- start:7509 stop:8153 length:645 start_codon:yes stop_codon:yes gene_type:complete
MRIILFSIISIIFFIIISSSCFESFVIEHNADLQIRNKDRNIFNRHPINFALSDDKIIKYKNAYYYEYDNSKYEKKLKETFKTQKCFINNYVFNKWVNEPSIEINAIYQKVYDFLYDKLNNSNYLALEEYNKIQIVHDVLNKYTIENNITILDLDMILYRQHRSNAKHVNLKIAIKNNEFNVYHIKVLGTVNEDKLHMYPVQYNDILNHNYSSL